MLPALPVECLFQFAPTSKKTAAAATTYRRVAGDVLWDVEINSAAALAR